MIKFSVKQQAFFDTSLLYSGLPNDLIDITDKQHGELLNALNTGCIVFKDLTLVRLSHRNFIHGMEQHG